MSLLSAYLLFLFFKFFNEETNFSFAKKPEYYAKKYSIYKDVYGFCELFVIINNDALLNNNGQYKRNRRWSMAFIDPHETKNTTQIVALIFYSPWSSYSSVFCFCQKHWMRQLFSRLGCTNIIELFFRFDQLTWNLFA